MNTLTTLPNEILFHCVTGYSSYSNHQAIKHLICSGNHVKSTCKDLHEKIEKCWNSSLDALWQEWKTCPSLKHFSKEQFVKQISASPRILLNWVDGKPEISGQSLFATLKDGFSLEIKPEDEDSLLEISLCGDYPIPTHWTSLANQSTVAFTRSTPFGDATFFNLKTGKSIGALVGQADRKLIFNQDIKPIFYKNEMIISFKLGPELSEIAWYEIESEKISHKKSVSISQKISSIYLFNDHLIFQAHDVSWSLTTNIKVLSLSDLKFIPPSHTIWPSPFSLEFFKDRILMFRYFEGLVFHTLCIEKGNLKFNRYKAEGNNSVRYTSTQTFYYNSNHAFFITCTTGKDHSISAISLSELNSSDAALTPFSSLPKMGFAKLIQFKNTVILCSGKMGSPLQFHHVDAKNGEIELTPFSIHDTHDYKFIRIDCVYAHLDKLFIIGVLAKDVEMPAPTNYLVIVNMETKSMESKHLLNLDMHPEIIATGVGCLYIFNPEKKNILQIKY